ncbi:hypothetical protein DdX_11897 [Ditylenchus destructor]|uniref:Uncharacterized protein n=1 Tax=Ditylenchus destructor TaxID=166010 RepID=A0AAD4R4A0_9BILA|nr:hypothetical protein DdX_11897 [Ditylenchus destructor]
MLMFSSRLCVPMIFWIFLLAGILSIEFATAPETHSQPAAPAKKPKPKKKVGFGGNETRNYEVEVDRELTAMNANKINKDEDAGEAAAWKAKIVDRKR